MVSSEKISDIALRTAKLDLNQDAIVESKLISPRDMASDCEEIIQSTHLYSQTISQTCLEDIIAEHLVGNYPLGRMVDVIIGGGRCFFLPNSTQGSCRSDDTDVVKMAKEKFGFHYIDNRKDFDHLQSSGEIKLPLLALMADTDIPYEIDRQYQDDKYPSLEEMTKSALKILESATKDSEQGFFIMIEGSRIDHAGHGNDPGAQVHDSDQLS